MTFLLNLKSYIHKNVIRLLILLTLWLLGLITGVVFDFNFSYAGRYLLVDALWRQSSWIVTFVVFWLPVVFCVVLIYYDFFLVNCALVLVNAVCRAFCGYLVFLCFGSGAWLIRSCFFFSSSISSVLQWWLILKSLFFAKRAFFKDILIASVSLLLFTLLDHFLISPFLLRLLMNI